MNPVSECNTHCHCDYVKYNPICSQDGRTTFISACHAGCRTVKNINDTTVFSNCSCISKKSLYFERQTILKEPPTFEGGFAYPGSCQVDCLNQFYIFLFVVCLLKFSGATGRASNFLVTVR